MTVSLKGADLALLYVSITPHPFWQNWIAGTCYTEYINSYCRRALAVNSTGIVRRGETSMSSNDKKNKAGREDRKKAKLNPKEKRKLKNEKKKKSTPFGS